jgi:hypothetical protein
MPDDPRVYVVVLVILTAGFLGGFFYGVNVSWRLETEERDEREG